jgi:hypothetical protein
MRDHDHSPVRIIGNTPSHDRDSHDGCSICAVHDARHASGYAPLPIVDVEYVEHYVVGWKLADGSVARLGRGRS